MRVRGCERINAGIATNPDDRSWSYLPDVWPARRNRVGPAHVVQRSLHGTRLAHFAPQYGLISPQIRTCRRGRSFAETVTFRLVCVDVCARAFIRRLGDDTPLVRSPHTRRPFTGGASRPYHWPRHSP